jgi:hypothetical protein
MLKRYAVFLFETHDAAGGWHAFNESFDSLEEAKKPLAGCDNVVWEGHVVDLQTGQIVYNSRR